MYGSLTPDLARARLKDRLARAEAQQLASTARPTRPSRPRARIFAIPRLRALRPITRRPAT